MGVRTLPAPSRNQAGCWRCTRGPCPTPCRVVPVDPTGAAAPRPGARALTLRGASPCAPAQPSSRPGPEPLVCLWGRSQLASRTALRELGSSVRAVIILFQKEAKACNSEPAAGSALPTCRLLQAAPRCLGGGVGLGGTTGRVRGGHGQGVQGPQAGCGRSSGDLLPVEWGRLPDPGQGLRAASPLCLWEECAAGAPAASWVRSLHPGPTASAAWTGHVPGSEGPGHSGGTHCAPGALGFGQDPLLSWRPLSAGDPSLGCRPQLLPSHSARTPAAHSSETQSCRKAAPAVALAPAALPV